MEEQTYKELKYANWVPFFKSFDENINAVSKLGAEVYFNSKLINIYFAKINQLAILYQPYLMNFEELHQRILKIGDLLFSYEYIKQVDRNSKSVSGLQFRVIKRLDLILKEMVKDFSAHSLIPKVNELKRLDPGKAVLNATY